MTPAPERCGTCRWFATVLDAHQPTQFGNCRRFPPQSVTGRRENKFGRTENFTATAWPEVADFDWCGEYQPAEGDK